MPILWYWAKSLYLCASGDESFISFFLQKPSHSSNFGLSQVEWKIEDKKFWRKVNVIFSWFFSQPLQAFYSYSKSIIILVTDLYPLFPKHSYSMHKMTALCPYLVHLCIIKLGNYKKTQFTWTETQSISIALLS